jgi:hypothetical protein
MADYCRSMHRTTMHLPAPTSADDVLWELRHLCARLPVPQPGWHPYVALIAGCRHDFEHALTLTAEHPAALDLFAALAEGDLDLTFDPAGSPELASAWVRLEELPIPEGQHPYLDDILPALEALRLLLISLSRTKAA